MNADDILKMVKPIKPLANVVKEDDEKPWWESTPSILKPIMYPLYGISMPWEAALGALGEVGEVIAGEKTWGEADISGAAWKSASGREWATEKMGKRMSHILGLHKEPWYVSVPFSLFFALADPVTAPLIALKAGTAGVKGGKSLIGLSKFKQLIAPIKAAKRAVKKANWALKLAKKGKVASKIDDAQKGLDLAFQAFRAAEATAGHPKVITPLGALVRKAKVGEAIKYPFKQFAKTKPGAWAKKELERMFIPNLERMTIEVEKMFGDGGREIAERLQDVLFVGGMRKRSQLRKMDMFLDKLSGKYDEFAKMFPDEMKKIQYLLEIPHEDVIKSLSKEGAMLFDELRGVQNQMHQWALQIVPEEVLTAAGKKRGTFGVVEDTVEQVPHFENAPAAVKSFAPEVLEVIERPAQFERFLKSHIEGMPNIHTSKPSEMNNWLQKVGDDVIQQMGLTHKGIHKRLVDVATERIEEFTRALKNTTNPKRVAEIKDVMKSWKKAKIMAKHRIKTGKKISFVMKSSGYGSADPTKGIVNININSVGEMSMDFRKSVEKGASALKTVGSEMSMESLFAHNMKSLMVHEIGHFLNPSKAFGKQPHHYPVYKKVVKEYVASLAKKRILFVDPSVDIKTVPKGYETAEGMLQKLVQGSDVERSRVWGMMSGDAQCEWIQTNQKNGVENTLKFAGYKEMKSSIVKQLSKQYRPYAIEPKFLTPEGKKRFAKVVKAAKEGDEKLANNFIGQEIENLVQVSRSAGKKTRMEKGRGFFVPGMTLGEQKLHQFTLDMVNDAAVKAGYVKPGGTLLKEHFVQVAREQLMEMIPKASSLRLLSDVADNLPEIMKDAKSFTKTIKHKVNGKWVTKNVMKFKADDGFKLISELATGIPDAYKGLQVRAEVADYMKNFLRETLDPKKVSNTMRLMDKALGLLRGTTLVFFPAYHMRNWGSNFFNVSYKYGSRQAYRNYVRAIGLISDTTEYQNAKKLFKEGAWYKKPFSKMGHRLRKHMPELNWFGDVKTKDLKNVWLAAEKRWLKPDELLDLAKDVDVWDSGWTSTALQTLGKGGGKFTKMVRHLGGAGQAVVENPWRLSVFMAELENGKTVAQATKAVAECMFNFKDITKFEKSVLKRLFYFPIWTRKNIPYQAKMLLEQPERAMYLFKLKNAWENHTDLPDPIPDWIQTSLHIPVRKSWKEKDPVSGKMKTKCEAFVMKNWLPIADLMQLHPRELIREIANMLQPLIKLPVETLFIPMIEGQGGAYSLFKKRYYPEYERIPLMGVDLPPKVGLALQNIRLLTTVDRLLNASDSPYAPDALQRVVRAVSGLSPYKWTQESTAKGMLWSEKQDLIMLKSARSRATKLKKLEESLRLDELVQEKEQKIKELKKKWHIRK